MNESEKTQVAISIALTAEYYGKTISKAVISMMVSDLSDLDASRVLESYQNYRRDGKNRFFPLPAQIRELVNFEISPEDKGREVASRVQSAVTKFGYSNPEDAKEYIGEVGWHCVNRFGGWGYVCENLGTNLQVLTFQAQVRDLAQVTIKSKLAGKFDQPIGLPSRTQAEAIESQKKSDLLKIAFGSKSE